MRLLIPKCQAGEEEKVWDVTIRAPSNTARNLVIRSAEDKADKITRQQPNRLWKAVTIPMLSQRLVGPVICHRKTDGWGNRSASCCDSSLPDVSV